MKANRVSKWVAPPFLKLGPECKWSTSPLGCLTSAGEGRGGIRYAFNRRLGGPHVQSGSFREEKTLVPAGIQTSNRPTRSAVTIPKTLSQIRAQNLVTLVSVLTPDLSHSFSPVLYNRTQHWVRTRNHNDVKMQRNIKLLCQESSFVSQFQTSHFTDRTISQNVSALGLMLGCWITYASSRNYLPLHQISLRWDWRSIQQIERSDKGTHFRCKLGKTRLLGTSR